MEGVLQDLAGVGSGVSLGLVARWAVVARKEFFFEKKSWLQERSREPSPAPDCLQRKIETLRSHPTEIFNFMVVGGTPRLGGCLQIWQYSVRRCISASYSEDDENIWLWHLILACL